MSRLLPFSIAGILAGMGVVFLAIVLSRHTQSLDEPYIRLNDIQGIGIVVQGKEYTLNFEQQNKTAILLNQSTPFLEAESKDLMATEYSELIIYSFQASPIHITPKGFDHENLIFSTTIWNHGKTLKDASNGKLKDLLSTTYSH